MRISIISMRMNSTWMSLPKNMKNMIIMSNQSIRKHNTNRRRRQAVGSLTRRINQLT